MTWNKFSKINYKTLFYVCISLVFLVGFYNGVIIDGSSQDLQYFPSKLFFEGIDYYNSYLEKNKWFLSQAPNYYFQLHFLLSPFTPLGWIPFKIIWFVFSSTLLIIVFEDLKKRYNVNYKTLTFYLLPFFLGFPLTNTLGNGQFGIVVVFLVYFSWVFRKKSFFLSILLFLLLSKYSFGLPIIFGFFLMGYYRSIIISIITTISFPLIYSFIFDLNFLETIFLPLKVASISTAIGPSDIMSLSRVLFSDTNVSLVFITTFNLIFLSIISYYSIKKRISDIQILLSSIVFSFIGFFHLGYDWVVLILILFFMRDGLLKKIFYGIVLFNFTIPRILKVFDINTIVDVHTNPIFISINIILLSTLFFNIINDKSKESLFN